MSEGVPSSLVASVGIGLQFLAMAQVDGESGLWPVVLSRAVSVVAIAVVLAPYGARWTMPAGAWAAAVAAGMVGTGLRSCCTWKRPRGSSWPWPPCSRRSTPPRWGSIATLAMS